MSEISTQLISILNTEANSFIELIRHNLDKTGTTATGKSKESIHKYIAQEGQKITLEILAKPFFSVVETGRKPTPDKKPSREMIENIREWTKVRGMEGAEWAVAIKINNEGTNLWKGGGRTDIYTDESRAFADRIADEVTRILADAIVENV